MTIARPMRSVSEASAQGKVGRILPCRRPRPTIRTAACQPRRILVVCATALGTLHFSVAADAGVAGAAANTEDMRVPDILDCDDLPEWRSFRLAAQAAVIGGFYKSSDLRNQAVHLEEKWRSWVCPHASGNCHTAADLSFDFVREMERQCRDSNNFERYLIRHFFVNTGRTFEPLQGPSGFCPYGYAMALVVLAWHALPERVGEALRFLYIARHFTGHYHAFDYFESSSWPLTSFILLLNLQHVGDSFIPMLAPPDYGHPGQYGTSWYSDRLRWTGTIEEAKVASDGGVVLAAPGTLTKNPLLQRELSSAKRRLVIWQFCIHTSTAGEAVTMITNFLGKEFDVEFQGNSVALQLCGNYNPSLCPPPRNLEFIDWLASRFVENDAPYEDLVGRFRDRMLGELLEADVWMCSIPAVWCRLLADVGRSALGKPGMLARPIFAYLGLPILQYVAQSDRMDFLHAIRALIEDSRSVVVANNAYLAEEVLWQTGTRVPTLRIHGLHTNATYVPLRSSEVLVSRPGTSGGLQECILRRFTESNPSYPLQFVQFTDLLNPRTTQEVYNNSLSYTELGKFRALVSFPYDTSLMLFWEFYSMNMPIFVPFQLWRWGIFGQHTRPDLEQPTLAHRTGEVDRPPFSPFFDGFGLLDLDRAVFWSKYTDWAMFPNIQYFSTISELMVSLVEADLQTISASMKRFNAESLVQTVEVWRHVLQRLTQENR